MKAKTKAKPITSTTNLITSSTPQRATTTALNTKTRPSPPVEIQDDEALLDEVLTGDQDDDDDDNADSDEMNTSDVAPGTDEDDQTVGTSIRQRQVNK